MIRMMFGASGPIFSRSGASVHAVWPQPETLDPAATPPSSFRKRRRLAS
jgi:hypothetical protein